MIDGFVADASVAVGWFHPGQATPQTRELLQAVYDGTRVEVPAIWPLEIYIEQSGAALTFQPVHARWIYAKAKDTRMTSTSTKVAASSNQAARLAVTACMH